MAIPAQARGVLDFIGHYEAHGDYNTVYSGARNKPVALTNMTIAEVMQWQKATVRAGSASSAAGKYQFINATLAGLVRNMGLTGNELFDADMQDRLGFELLRQRGYDKYAAGKMSASDFGNNIAREWASMPVVSGPGAGKSYYHGDGLNGTSVPVGMFMGAITGKTFFNDYVPGDYPGDYGRPSNKATQPGVADDSTAPFLLAIQRWINRQRLLAYLRRLK